MKSTRPLPRFAPVEPSAPVERQIPERAIFWPGHVDYSGDPSTPDLSAFPSLAAMKARASASPPSPLAAFAKAVSEAQDRVLIMDRFLFAPEHKVPQVNIDAVLAWFGTGPAASDIRILSTAPIKDHADVLEQFSELAKLINANQPHRASGMEIRINFNLKQALDDVHDRFAIVDDEFWHFGATVGGLYPGLSAASRGWPARKHGAIAFFDSAWKVASTLAQRHDKGASRA